MKVKMILLLIVTTLILTGCDDYSPTEKNIYHSKWKSSDGYQLIINDPELNSDINKPMCVIKLGERKIGACTAIFNKNDGTLTLSWVDYNPVRILGGTMISKDTSEFSLGDIKFTFEGNIVG